MKLIEKLLAMVIVLGAVIMFPSLLVLLVMVGIVLAIKDRDREITNNGK